MAAGAIGGIISGAADALGGVSAGIPYMMVTPYDIHNKKRLKELQRKAELEVLGLTPEQRQALFAAQNRQAEAARAEMRDASEAASQAWGAQGAGMALRGQRLAEELAARTASDIGATVAATDIAREQEEQQELEDRLAYKAARMRQQASAVSSMLMPILGTAKDSLAQMATTEAQGDRQAASKQASGLDMESLTEEQRAYYETSGVFGNDDQYNKADYSEFANQVTSMQGGTP